MQTLNHKLVLLTQEKKLSVELSALEPFTTEEELFIQNEWSIQALIVDLVLFNKKNIFDKIQYLQNQNKIQKIVLTYNAEEPALLNTRFYNEVQPSLIRSSDSLKIEDLYKTFETIQQSQQNENYILLSSELNEQYEQIKSELQSEIKNKTETLAESQRQISEINTRFDLLRKALFISSKSKDLISVEADLSMLLMSQQKITELKIIPNQEFVKFEDHLTSLNKTSYKVFNLTIESNIFKVYFFKDDKRSFKKSDVDLFAKLVETIQINLNRQIKIKNLTRNERLFDLAFHSSPQYIVVLDDDYNIVQANLAVEKIISEDDTNLKCYSILYKRNLPCVGCQRGSQFQIQSEQKTFLVQSKIYDSNDDLEKNHWVNMYEDISEQISLESKFQQTARLAELGLISSSIAHELNNPLGGILSYLQIMKLDLPQQHLFQQDLILMFDTAQRMKKIIEDLLIFSRKEDIPSKVITSLEDILQKNIEMLQVQLKKENLNIVLSDDIRSAKVAISTIHFRSSIHLVLQYLIQRQKVRKQINPPFVGLVEVKFFHNDKEDLLIFLANSGPIETLSNTKDLTLMALEKTLLDQGFQARLTDDKVGWVKVEIRLPK